MKKLLSLMFVLCLLPMFSLAEHSIAANYIYQMILKQVDGTDFTRYDDDYEVMFFYPLSKHTYGDAVVRITPTRTAAPSTSATNCQLTKP